MDYHLKVDRRKWHKSRKGILKLLHEMGPIKGAPPLDLDEIFKTVYAIKKEREKETPRPIEVYFPTEAARDEFMAMMKAYVPPTPTIDVKAPPGPTCRRRVISQSYRNLMRQRRKA